MGNSTDVLLRLHYVDVPLAFRIHTGGLFFEAGPQVGFLAATKSQVGSASTDVKDSFDTVDFGYLFGPGYQLKQGFSARLRYNGGFTKVPEALTFGNPTSQSRQRNSAFQFYLTYSGRGR